MLRPNQNNLQNALEDNSYFLNEIASMTQTGGYGCNLLDRSIFMDDIARNLLGIPHDYKLQVDNIKRFFKNSSTLNTVLKAALKGESSLLDVELLRFDGHKIWVRFNCNPYLENGKTVGLRGVLTSINQFIKNTQKVEKAALTIKAQNERQVHFAHMLSHNLRSHASNLQLTLETFEDVDSNEVEVFQSYLTDISQSLNQTLTHLNEVVTINNELKNLENIDIEASFNSVLKEFEKKLSKIDAVVSYDFAELMSIDYVPSFMESIFRNLLSNSIKYRSDQRALKISIKTKIKNKRNLLIIKDNGIGIDLKRNGNKLFHMYRTFHTNEDAKGVGLFLVKSKVEALGGDITVQSELGKGSSFSIRFN